MAEDVCINAPVLYHIYMKIALPLVYFIANVYKTSARIKIRETRARLAMTKRSGFIVDSNKNRAVARIFYSNCL